MKKLTLCLIASQLVSSVAMADLPAESQYATDRSHAIGHLTPALKNQCMEDFTHKAQHASVQPIGDLVYNDAVSRAVYQAFYWKSSDRGVAFTVPVKAQKDSDKISGGLACFYSMTDRGLQFQQSQRIAKY